MSKPAIIYSQDYLSAKNNGKYLKYERFIDYINNEKKVMQNKKDYIDYIENEEKTSFPSFSAVGTLNDQQVDEIRSRFEKSRKNDNNLYRGVFSFDNDFLISEGLIDEQFNVIDKDKMIVCIQNAMKELNKNSRIDMDKMVWIANFHFNTDNIHCHVAYIDEDEDRLSKEQKAEMVINEKGMEKAKSKVINSIIQDKEFLKEKSRIRDEMRRNISIDEDSVFELVAKYGKKLLYLNTEKSVFTNEEIEDINEKLFNIITKDEEMLKYIIEYNELGVHLDKKYNEYYGGQEGRFLEGMNEDVCKIMQTSLKKSLRKISKEKDSFFSDIKLLSENKKRGTSSNNLLNSVRSNYINYKLTNNLKRMIKRDIYEQINEQERINMSVYYNMQGR